MMHHLPTYCSASEMFTVNRVPNCAAVIRNLTFRFMSRPSLPSNALVCSIIDSDLKFVVSNQAALDEHVICSL